MPVTRTRTRSRRAAGPIPLLPSPIISHPSSTAPSRFPPKPPRAVVPSDPSNRPLFVPSKSGHDLACHRVYGCSELIATILFPLDHANLTKFSRVSFVARDYARAEFKDRVVETFFPHFNMLTIDSLTSKLYDTNGGVTGSHVRRLLALGSDFMKNLEGEELGRFTTSYDLNFVVPGGDDFKVLQEHLASVGYSDWVRLSPSKLYRNSICYIHHAFRYIEGSNKTLHITVSESYHGVIKPMLAAPLTAQTNLLTATRVFSLFPHLVSQREAMMTNFARSDPEFHDNPCFDTTPNNSNWKDCGLYCPAAVRKTRGDKGVASFWWSSNPSHRDYASPRRQRDTDAHFGGNLYTFKFGRCRRHKCFRYTPAIIPKGFYN